MHASNDVPLITNSSKCADPQKKSKGKIALGQDLRKLRLEKTRSQEEFITKIDQKNVTKVLACWFKKNPCPLHLCEPILTAP